MHLGGKDLRPLRSVLVAVFIVPISISEKMRRTIISNAKCKCNICLEIDDAGQLIPFIFSHNRNFGTVMNGEW